MTTQQYKKLQFLTDTMNSYGIGERGYRIAQHAFRHLHYDILGRSFRCDLCAAGRREIERIKQQKGRSYEAILNHCRI